jgi:hypothetical protein
MTGGCAVLCVRARRAVDGHRRRAPCTCLPTCAAAPTHHAPLSAGVLVCTRPHSCTPRLCLHACPHTCPHSCLGTWPLATAAPAQSPTPPTANPPPGDTYSSGFSLEGAVQSAKPSVKIGGAVQDLLMAGDNSSEVKYTVRREGARALPRRSGLGLFPPRTRCRRPAGRGRLGLPSQWMRHPTPSSTLAAQHDAASLHARNHAPPRPPRCPSP